MSFRRRTNRHDAWAAHCDRSATTIASTGLPSQVFETERGLREFLTTGRREDVSADLNAISDEQFCRLFHFVSSFFDYDVVDFTALEHRRLTGRRTPAAG